MILGLISLFTGTYLLINVFNKLLRLRRIYAYGKRSKGKIIKVIREQGPDSIQLYPVIQFTTQTGETIEIKSNTGSFNSKISDSLEVIYLEDNPNEFIIDSFYGKHYPIAITFIFSIILLIIVINYLLNFS